MVSGLNQWGLENLCSKDYCDPECAEHFIRGFCADIQEKALFLHESGRWSDGSPYTVEESYYRALRELAWKLLGEEL